MVYNSTQNLGKCLQSDYICQLLILCMALVILLWLIDLINLINVTKGSVSLMHARGSNLDT